MSNFLLEHIGKDVLIVLWAHSKEEMYMCTHMCVFGDLCFRVPWKLVKYFSKYTAVIMFLAMNIILWVCICVYIYMHMTIDFKV